MSRHGNPSRLRRSYEANVRSFCDWHASRCASVVRAERGLADAFQQLIADHVRRNGFPRPSFGGEA